MVVEVAGAREEVADPMREEIKCKSMSNNKKNKIKQRKEKRNFTQTSQGYGKKFSQFEKKKCT